MIRSVQSGHVFRHALLVTALCLLTFFAGLGRSAIGDADEAFYAQSAREMVEQGDWITPHYNYEYRFQKPVFFYWLVAGAYQVAGVSEAAARFPSALAGLALALMTWGIARRWVDPRTGLLAGVIVGTSFGYFSIARASLPDLPLAAFITLATWSLFEAGRTDGGATPGSRRGWLLVASLAVALGMLTKGPVAVALPVLVYLVVRVVLRESVLPSRDGWFGLRWTDMALGAAIAVAVSLPWYLAMADTHGPAYLQRFFVGENLERFATARYNDRRPFWFYAPIILGGLAPWSSLLVLWVPSAKRVFGRTRQLTPVEWRLVLWAAVPVIFYTLSVGQQPRYILPVLPPLAVLLARTLLSRLAASDAAGRRHVGVAGAITASALAFLILAFLLLRARPLLFALSPVSGQVGTVVIILTAVALLAYTWLGRQRWLPAAVAIAATATLVSLHYSVYSAAGLEPVQQMARHVKAVRHDEPSGTYRAFVRNLVFYTGVKQHDLADLSAVATFLRQPQRVLCVMPLDEVEGLQRDHGVRVHQLASVVYFNPAAVRLRTLFSPEPARDLETVVLVSNQP
jgi:4-amino-4-deoxy-L-arabinose transferase-like glycosyltransferase